MVKKRKKNNGFVSGVLIVLCFLIVFPVLVLSFRVFNIDASKVDKKPVEESVLYYQVSFDVGSCCNPIEPIFVKVGEQPVLPTVEFVCSHKSFDEENGSLSDAHSFVGWTYNGQLVSQSTCPAFNTSVVLVADICSLPGFSSLADFDVSWLEYEN